MGSITIIETAFMMATGCLHCSSNSLGDKIETAGTVVVVVVDVPVV